MRSNIRVLVIVLSIILIIILSLPKIANNMITEFYSPNNYSSSIKDSKLAGKFLFEVVATNKKISSNSDNIIIKNIWIEHIIKIEYRWGLHERKIPVGFRLILQPNTQLRSGRLLCNSFQLSQTYDGVYIVEIIPPLPTKVHCRIEDDTS